jgi:hypothetical protein
MNDTDPDKCARCEVPDRPTIEHVIHFFDDRNAKRVNLCAPCVRMIQQSENGVRSIV